MAFSSTTFATATFQELPSDSKVEEEDIPGYAAENYYPVALGEVLASRYHIISKLGCGVGSTVWLCRDLQ